MRAFAFFFLTLINCKAHCLTVNPIELYFTPEGTENTQSIKLANPSKEPIAVQLKAYTRKHTPDGKEQRIITDDFLIYPPQTILKPGETKTARLTWLGRKASVKKSKKETKIIRTKKIDKELPYRLKVTQLPVDVKEEKKPKKTGVKMIYQYVASLYVRERGFKPELKLIAARRIKDDLTELTIENTGKQHTLLKYYDIKQKQNKKAIYKRIENLSDEILTTNILAGSIRKIQLTVNKNFPGGSSSFVLEKKK